MFVNFKYKKIHRTSTQSTCIVLPDKMIVTRADLKFKGLMRGNYFIRGYSERVFEDLKRVV